MCPIWPSSPTPQLQLTIQLQNDVPMAQDIQLFELMQKLLVFLGTGLCPTCTVGMNGLLEHVIYLQMDGPMPMQPIVSNSSVWR